MNVADPIKGIRVIVDVSYIDGTIPKTKLIGLLSGAVQERLMVKDLKCGGIVFGFSTDYQGVRSVLNDSPQIRSEAELLRATLGGLQESHKAASLDEAVEAPLDAYSNNVDDPYGEQPVRAVSDAALLSEINRRGMLQPLYGAIGAMHDHLDRTGALDERLAQYLTYRLRREEAAITGMPDSAARVTNWQECIDQLDREARAVKAEDSPSPGM